MKWLFFTLPLIWLLSACSSMKVSSDYDTAYNFKQLSTFAVVYPQKNRSLTQERIAKALNEQMIAKGYTQTDQAHADFVLLFHTDVTQKKQVVTDYQTVGFYPYYGYGYHAPMAVPVQREYSYDEAKIIIDALDPDGNKIFWRGVAADRLQSFDTPQERSEYIKSVIAETLASFPNRQ
jgi:hypothetical protein